MRDLARQRQARISRRRDSVAPEEQLLSELAAGNDAAFDDLLIHYSDDLLALCRSLCRQQADIEDAYQETLRAMWQALPTFEGRNGAQLATWLYRICTNTVNGIYRRRVAQPVAPGSFTAGIAESNVAQTAVDNNMTREALNHLPDDFRTALILADVLDLAYRDIASLQGVSESTVKTRVFRARQAMRHLLGGER